MNKVLIILLPVAVFTTTVLTTIHSFADIQEHSIHLVTLGIISLLFILYVIKDSIKIKNRMMVVTILLLLSFSTIRVFSCHLITENPQDLAQSNVINNPCCSAVIDAIPTITVAPTTEMVTPVEQQPVTAQIRHFFYNLTNKSPPQLSA